MPFAFNEHRVDLIMLRFVNLNESSSLSAQRLDVRNQPCSQGHLRARHFESENGPGNEVGKKNVSLWLCNFHIIHWLLYDPGGGAFSWQLTVSPLRGICQVRAKSH